MISGSMSFLVILGKTLRAPESLKLGIRQLAADHQETSNFKYRALFRRLPLAVCQMWGQNYCSHSEKCAIESSQQERRGGGGKIPVI